MIGGAECAEGNFESELELQEYLDEQQLQQVIAGIREGSVKTVTLGPEEARSG